MTDFIVNGVHQSPPLAGDEKFKALLEFIHRHYDGDLSIISSIRVNGVELNENDEHELSQVELGDIDSVEVRLASPKEVAHNTLEALLPFTRQLSSLSVDAANNLRLLTQLVDGIQTFTDSITAVKSAFRVGFLPTVNVLEMDLVSIMTDLLEAHQKGDGAYRSDLLREHLPLNLADWEKDGIPTLQRLRDC